MSERHLPVTDDGLGNFRFAANLKWLFTDVPLEERFQAASLAGFNAVEVPSPYDFSRDRCQQLVSDAGVELALINTPPGDIDGRRVTGIACHPALRHEFRAGVERGLEYATELGIGSLHVVAGPRPENVSTERSWDEYLFNIAWAVDAAKSTDVTLLIEPQNSKSSPRFGLTTQEQAARVIEVIGSDCLKILVDIFHVQMQEGDVSTRLRELAPLIGHVQIADTPDRNEPGTGELSWHYLFRRLAEIGYSGWVGCEYAPTNPSAAHINWLQQFGDGLEI